MVAGRRSLGTQSHNLQLVQDLFYLIKHHQLKKKKIHLSTIVALNVKFGKKKPNMFRWALLCLVVGCSIGTGESDGGGGVEQISVCGFNIQVFGQSKVGAP